MNARCCTQLTVLVGTPLDSRSLVQSKNGARSCEPHLRSDTRLALSAPYPLSDFAHRGSSRTLRVSCVRQRISPLVRPLAVNIPAFNRQEQQ
jgi:hypothetical protein